MLSEMFVMGKRPFYNSTVRMYLDPIPFESYYQFAERLMRKHKRVIDEASFRSIYQFFIGSTFYIQKTLNALFSRGKLKLGEEEVATELEAMLLQFHPEASSIRTLLPY